MDRWLVWRSEMKDPKPVQKISGAAKLSGEVQAKLAQQLRAMYADIIEEGLPERFAKLLAARKVEKENNT
jgi:hypothetical protein